jgi:hypothetical protein
VDIGSRFFPLLGSYRVTQRFGCVEQNDGYSSSEHCPDGKPSFHNGLDLAAPTGTPILAAASGIVTFVGIDPASRSGNSMLVIEHDGANAGFRTQYLHWRHALVTAGQYVTAGQEIDEVGSIGYSIGSHLHFSVFLDSAASAIDPEAWLQSAGVSVEPNTNVSDEAAANVLRWAPLIRSAADQYGVPAVLIAAIMAIESGDNPAAVSPAGAQGLMQVMPEQLTRLGVPAELWQDPASMLAAGARYLAETLSNGGSLEEAATRYFGSGCDVGGTCTDQYIEQAMYWYAYYMDCFP